MCRSWVEQHVGAVHRMQAGVPPELVQPLAAWQSSACHQPLGEQQLHEIFKYSSCDLRCSVLPGRLPFLNKANAAFDERIPSGRAWLFTMESADCQTSQHLLRHQVSVQYALLGYAASRTWKDSAPAAVGSVWQCICASLVSAPESSIIRPTQNRLQGATRRMACSLCICTKGTVWKPTRYVIARSGEQSRTSQCCAKPGMPP